MTHVLDRAAAHAATFLQTLPSRPIAPTATVGELQHRLGKPLPETGLADETVIDELVRDAEGGLMGSGNGRFFGWVIGGTLPVALAADWLTSTGTERRLERHRAGRGGGRAGVRRMGQGDVRPAQVRFVRLRDRLSDGAHHGARLGAPQAAARPRLGRRGQGPVGRAAAAHPDDREPP